MALQITGVTTGFYNSDGIPITASYWKIMEIKANVLNKTFSCTINGYASSSSYQANPNQKPIAHKQIIYPDPINAKNAIWPFDPATLAANYPNNSQAFLLAAQAYVMLYTFFSGATMVP